MKVKGSEANLWCSVALVTISCGVLNQPYELWLSEVFNCFDRNWKRTSNRSCIRRRHISWRQLECQTSSEHSLSLTYLGGGKGATLLFEYLMSYPFSGDVPR